MEHDIVYDHYDVLTNIDAKPVKKVEGEYPESPATIFDLLKQEEEQEAWYYPSYNMEIAIARDPMNKIYEIFIPSIILGLF